MANERGEPKIDPGLLEHYRASVVTVVDAGRVVEATELSARLEQPLFVITAWNPRSKRRSRAENDHRDCQLRAMLEARRITYWRSQSRDQMSSWREEGYAIGGIDVNEALDLARGFDQFAIFLVTGESVNVIAC